MCTVLCTHWGKLGLYEHMDIVKLYQGDQTEEFVGYTQPQKSAISPPESMKTRIPSTAMCGAHSLFTPNPLCASENQQAKICRSQGSQLGSFSAANMAVRPSIYLYTDFFL